MQRVLLLSHDSDGSTAVQGLEWELLDQPTYSLDFTVGSFHLLSKLRECLGGNAEVKC